MNTEDYLYPYNGKDKYLIYFSKHPLKYWTYESFAQHFSDSPRRILKSAYRQSLTRMQDSKKVPEHVKDYIRKLQTTKDTSTAHQTITYNISHGSSLINNSTNLTVNQHQSEKQQDKGTEKHPSQPTATSQQQPLDEQDEGTEEHPSQPTVILSQQQPQQQQDESTEPTEESLADGVDIDLKICEHEDPRKLLFSWAYLCEADEETKVNKLLYINRSNLEKILAAPLKEAETAGETISLDKIINAEVVKLLKTYRHLNDKDDLLFLRLLLSQAVTTMAAPMARRSKALLGNDTYDSLVARSLNRFNLDHQPLEKTTEKVFDQVIEAYLTYGLVTAKTLLCDIKKELLNSSGMSFTLIAVESLEYVVTHIGIWNKPGKTSEYDYYGRFSCLFELIFQDNDIKMTSGDTASTSTKVIRMNNEKLFGHGSKNGAYGRKIDGIVCYHDLELCLCECKPPSVSSYTLIKQHVKNVRSNCCVYQHLQSLSPDLDDEPLHIYGIDFQGPHGVMFILCKLDGVMVATKVGDLIIPDDPYELDSMKTTIALLLDLKRHLSKLVRRYRSLQQRRKRKLDEDSSFGPTTPPYMSQATVSPSVFLTPNRPR